jgi:hypothetical protein
VPTLPEAGGARRKDSLAPTLPSRPTAEKPEEGGGGPVWWWGGGGRERVGGRLGGDKKVVCGP